MDQLGTPSTPGQPFARGSFEELDSLEDLREQIARLPSSARFSDEQVEIVYGIGYSLYMQGKFDKAANVFQMLLVYRPLDARILSAYGMCCKRMGRFSDAIPAFSAAMALDVQNLNTGVHMAECLVALGKRDETLHLLEPLIKLAELDETFDALRKRAETLRELLEGK